MYPFPAHRCGRDHAARLEFLPQDLVDLAVLPGRGAERFRPGIRIALALDADEYRRRGVLVRLRIASGLVLADPEIEPVAGHRGFDAPVARRTAVIERQLGID